jgi:uncharacterized protein (DUF362 family)
MTENRVVKEAGVVWSSSLLSYRETLPQLLDAAGLVDDLEGSDTIVIKPNLVEALDPPITTHVDLAEALVDYLQTHRPDVRIIIGEGTGSLEYDTFRCFRSLGYARLAGRAKVELVDLNIEPCRHLVNPACTRWPDLYLPELLFNCYLISVPVLKAHSMCRVTLTMKNMMGCAPPAHYHAGGWGKSAFHRRLDEAIFDLNRYRTADFSIIDAAVGMARAHLWGPTCEPPIQKILAGYDPVAIDAHGAELLGRRWQSIGHIRMADGTLGTAQPLDIREPAVA